MNKYLNNLKKIDSLDFRNNKHLLISSYLLRLFGILTFGFLFLMLTQHLKNNGEITIETLLTIQTNSFSPLISIVLIVISVIFVLYFHEIIHAAFYFITHKQKPKIGIRGFIIFAAAPKNILNKSQLIINALTPFTILTIIGIVLIYIIPENYLSWIFIPTIVNASAAGGDFMTIFWILKQPEDTKFIDEGDITYAYNFK